MIHANDKYGKNNCQATPQQLKKSGENDNIIDLTLYYLEGLGQKKVV